MQRSHTRAGEFKPVDIFVDWHRALARSGGVLQTRCASAAMVRP